MTTISAEAFVRAATVGGFRVEYSRFGSEGELRLCRDFEPSARIAFKEVERAAKELFEGVPCHRGGKTRVDQDAFKQGSFKVSLNRVEAQFLQAVGDLAKEINRQGRGQEGQVGLGEQEILMHSEVRAINEEIEVVRAEEQRLLGKLADKKAELRRGGAGSERPRFLVIDGGRAI